MAEEIRKNNKGPLFQKYLEEKNMTSAFERQQSNDSTQKMIFMTAIPVGNHRLLGTIITDNTMFVITRFHLGYVNRKDEHYDAFMHYLAEVNARHALFKMLVTEDGRVFIDSCCPFLDESFDPFSVNVTFSLVVDFLQNNYEEVLKHLDRPGDAREGISLSVN